MPYTSNQLISDAYFVAGILSREMETVSGGEAGDGLNLLNEILQEATINEGMIPYSTNGQIGSWDAAKVKTQAELVATYDNAAGTLTATVNGAIVIDSVSLEITDRVLVTEQVTGVTQFENGIYQVTIAGDAGNPYVLTRVSDASESQEFIPNKVIYIQEGTNSDTTYAYAGANKPVIGTTPIVFAPSRVNAIFSGIPGQETYFIPNLITLNTLTFTKDGVRYSMSMKQRDEYFGTSRTEGINSLPNSYNVERSLGGSAISMYFLPDESYLFEIKGIFSMAEVSLNEDLELTIEGYYRTYLKYALADRLCANYAFEVPTHVKKQLARYQEMICKQSRKLDLRMQKLSTLQNSQGINWGQVNLGRGWTTPRR
jgi:hypothetical protein